MQPEPEIQDDAGDYVDAFARRHGLSTAETEELRSYINEGPRVVRWFLDQVGIVADFPRAPAAGRRQTIDTGK